MKIYSKSFVSLLAAAVLASGCSVLPEPGSLIQAPIQTAAETDSKNLQLTVKKFLPKGTELAVPAAPAQAQPLLSIDFDGDGTDEIAAFYRSKNDRGTVGLFILKNDGGKWEKVYAEKGAGYEVSFAAAVDITGDGKKELLAGWKFGSTAGSALEVLTQQKNKFIKLAKLNYHELRVLQFEDDPQAKLAVWKKEGNDLYDVDIVKWKASRWQSDTAHYPSYFPEVANYYKQRTAAVPEASYYRYYLADALLKAKQPDEALAEINRGMAHTMVAPSYEQFSALRTEIENAVAKAGSGARIIDLPEGRMTMEIPAAAAPYIALEETAENMAYVLSVYFKQDSEKQKLFSVEVHAKDFYFETAADGERIAESDNLLYITKKAAKVKGSEMYEQCFALIDKMIANIRPGTVYPPFTDIENQLVIEQMRQAAEQYAYVTRGGELADEPVELFMKNDIQYRYMGDDLATKQQLADFLSSVYSAEAIRSYMEHAKLIEENGRLAQPNADGGSLLNYSAAKIIRRKDSGSEKEFDIKVPLGSSLVYETVHIVFTATKDGWRISSEAGTF